MKKVLIGIFTIIILAGILGGYILISGWHQPLGESLSMPTITPVERPQSNDVNETPLADPDGSDRSERTIEPTEPLSQETQTPICNGPPLMYILGVGSDSGSPDYLYGLADVIRIVRVDFITPRITVLTLPRDLWVEFPDIVEEHADRVTHGKLNQAYLYGGPGMGYYDGPGGGPGLLARTLAHNYSLNVDHYGAVNMFAFERIIDALGGIDIYLDQDWDGTPVDEDTEDMGYFPAGQHHMSGDEALRFSRIRKRYSEVTRTDNQTLVICAVRDKLLRPNVIRSIPQLINSLIGMVQTDLTPAQIRQLACVLPKLEDDDLQFIRFPDEMMVQGRQYIPNLDSTTFVWDIPVEDIRQFIQDFKNDAIPVDTEGGMKCP